MKQLLPLLFVLLSHPLLACPMCNIHNYLYSSVNSSTFIYHGKVVKAKKDDHAIVEIIEILKDEKQELPKVGELTTVYLYDPNEKIGDEFIFSNPFGHGPTFECVETDLKWEINYLIDSTRKVSTIDEALRLVEGISYKSNQDGIDYIEHHFSEAFDALVARMIALRRECQLDKDVYFGSYRLSNLVRALTTVPNERTKPILLQEVDSIQSVEYEKINVDDLRFNGSSPIGEYLRSILACTKKETFHKELIKSYRNALDNGSTSSNLYFVYALAFEHLEQLDTLEINDKNRDTIVLGLLSTARNLQYYRQRQKLEPILSKMKELNQNDEIKENIDKRFSK